MLNDIICPSKEWREVEFNRLLDDLQKYSLVTMVPIHNVITLRFIRLCIIGHKIACQPKKDPSSKLLLGVYLCVALRKTMIMAFKNTYNRTWPLSPLAAPVFISMIRLPFQYFLGRRKNVMHTSFQYRMKHVMHTWLYGHGYMQWWKPNMGHRACGLAVHYCNSQKHMGDINGPRKGGSDAADVIETRETFLGRDDPETAAARGSLARGSLVRGDAGDFLNSFDRLREAEVIQKDVLRVYIRTWVYVIGIRRGNDGSCQNVRKDVSL